MAHRIISRAESGLRPATRRTYIDTPTPELWLHHSAGALDAGGNGVWWDDVLGIQEFHMRPVAQGGRGWSDIAYSFLIGGGLIFEGRGVGIAGGHTAGHNRISHAICLIGNYELMEPTDEDLDAAAWLIGHGRRQGWWGELTGPHRDASGASTACCGRHLIARIPDLRRMAATTEEDPLAAFTEKQLRSIVQEESRRVLNEATQQGQKSGADTIKATLAMTQRNFNLLREVLAALGRDVDEAQLAAELAPLLADRLDLAAIAGDIAALLPPATQPDPEHLEAALRQVLVSLGSTEA